jgi:Predicted membrane protein
VDTTPQSDDSPPISVQQEIDRIQQSEEFRGLRSTFRGFAFPVTVAFIAWYLLYVLLSSYAGGFMSTRVVGHINVALVLGLLQFVSTFAIAWVYARFAHAKLDPPATAIRERYAAAFGNAPREGE